uniref:KASH domain-containing protein n=1 Tax=Steinernema glaseri TaxID=37863 RepID=A0A1I7YUY7_9BILA
MEAPSEKKCSSRLPEDKCGKQCKPDTGSDTGSTVEQPCSPEEHRLTHDPPRQELFREIPPHRKMKVVLLLAALTIIAITIAAPSSNPGQSALTIVAITMEASSSIPG